MSLSIWAAQVGRVLLSYPMSSLVLSLVAYECATVMYRLYLHPLAKFPGPKLAAVSRLYEFYFELAKGGGRMTQQLEKMHEQYGPIVRINPFELHIDDPNYYDTLYNFNPKLDKRELCMENIQHTASFDLHKLRRRGLEGFFSRKSVLDLEWLIKEGAEKMSTRMEEVKQSGEPISMSVLYRCLTADVISEYAFAQSYGLLDKPEEGKMFVAEFDKSFRTSYFLMREIRITSWLFRILRQLPPWAIPKQEGMLVVMNWLQSIKSRIQNIVSDEVKKSAERKHRTIIEEGYTNSQLPKEEKTFTRMYDDSVTLVSAGIETTGYTLSTATFHLLANPNINARLGRELAEVWPDTNAIPSWTTLEKVPYLRAVITEALRITVGAATRSARINHHESMQYGDWHIPPHTAVSMSSSFTSLNKTIFPEPWTFRPERWLRGEESKQLEKYLVSFSRGARQCLGINLAYAELYIVLATMFRRFDMELFETTRKDVDFKYDFFVPMPEGRNGVRVTVK